MILDAYRKLTDYMTGYDTCFAGPFFVQVVRDPEDLKIVLNSEEAYEKTLFSSFFYRYGLLTDGGEVYKHQRKVLSPLFSSSRLRYITPIINGNMTEFLKLFERMRKPEAVDFKHIATYFSTSSSLYTIFNIDIKDYDLLSEIIENTRL
jgi:cytochrome P450